MSEHQSTDRFAPLDHCAYMSKATNEDGQPGFALFDANGQIEMFTLNRSEVFFYAMRNELTYMLLN